MSRRVWMTAGSLALVVAAGAVTPATSAAAATAAPPAPVSTPAPTAPESVRTGDVIVAFKPGSGAAVSNSARDAALEQTAAATDTSLDEGRRLAGGATVVQGATPDDAATVAAALQRRPDVAYAEPDVRLTASSTNDPYSTSQWGLIAPSSATGGADVEAAWPTSTGRGVTVAVVDSGILTHPDLAGQVAAGYDFVSDVEAAGDGSGRDANPADPGDWTLDNQCAPREKGEPSSWHGTHVAGTIAAATNNRLGVAGVAPGAKILPVRVLGHCGGTLADIADGIVWAAGGTVKGAPANRTPAKVLNLSLGGPGACSKTLQTAISAARARGATVVTAAGNEGQPASRSMPGNCAGVIDVAAVSSAGERADFSDYGSPVALGAPGVGIYSTFDAGTRGPAQFTYASMDGTSMAAPHVSGVAALLLAARPKLTPDAVKAALVAGARPAPGAGVGAGLLDAARTLTAAGLSVRASTPPPGRPAALTASTTSAAPRITAAPMAARVAPTAVATASWAAFPGAVGAVRYDVQTRVVTTNSRGTQAFSPWRTAATASAATSLPVKATPGAVVQYRVRGTDARATTSAWSASGVLVYPLDATTATGTVTSGWSRVGLRSAVGATVLQTSRANAAFTARPAFTDTVYVLAATGPGGGAAVVYVDGVKRATVSTAARVLSGGRLVAKIAVPYGKHTVKVVAARGTLRLDAVGFGR